MAAWPTPTNALGASSTINIVSFQFADQTTITEKLSNTSFTTVQNRLHKMYRFLKASLITVKRHTASLYREAKFRRDFPHVAYGPNNAILYTDPSMLSFGHDVTIRQYSEISVGREGEKSRIRGKLLVGDRVYIGSFANIRAGGGEIHIGNHALLAQRVSLIASNHQVVSGCIHGLAQWDESKTGVFICSNVWLGAGTTVLPGVTIGENSVIAAGSIVTKSVPANEIWGGVPARKIKNV